MADQRSSDLDATERDGSSSGALDRSNVITGGLLNPPTQPSPRTQPNQGLPQTFLDRIRGVGLTADTVARSAVNLLTFDQADKAEAAADAFFEPGGLKAYRQRYQAALAQQGLRDRYDTAYRPKAQLAGQVGGTVLGFALTDGASGAGRAAPWLRSGPRLPGAARLTGRDMATIVGGGGLTGYGAQRFSDLLSGRQSSLGDQGGAIVGGMAGAAALPFGPARASAIDAAVTSAAQDIFNGRSVSTKQALQNAVVGNLVGGIAGSIAGRRSNNLPPKAKGDLGERLGPLRREANALPSTAGWRKARDYLGNTKRYWMPDDRSGDLRFEHKFGNEADLRANQKVAQQLLDKNFVLYHFLPSDLAKAASLPAGASAPLLANQARRQSK